jgi:hypothetical protein
MDEEEQNIQEAVSEQPDVDSQEDSQPNEPKMVPLSALEAERRKRQDSEAKAQLYQDYLMRAKEGREEDNTPKQDPNELVEVHKLDSTIAKNKREILEAMYQDLYPEKVRDIDKYLRLILEKKPWLSDSIDSAVNRWSRSAEIVEDYRHLVEPKKDARGVSDAQRIVQNSRKPGSPVEVGKSAQPRGVEYLKSIQGKKEFREYRQKVLQGST